MPDLYIIKLGGSVITEKEGNRFEVKREEIARISTEIKKAMDEKGFSLIVVHGAGPFGHTNVTEFDIDNGVSTEMQKEGYEKTVRDCNFLDSVVVEELKKAGIDAVGFDPNKFVKQDKKKIVEFCTKEIKNSLEEGKVPVLFGQMVPDKSLNASVMSGDAAIGFLAEKFGAKKVFLGTNVSGIFEEDPKKNSEAKRIPLIDGKNFDEIAERVGEAGTVDVTGGMQGKLEKLREMLQGATALIFNANQEGSVYKALVGKQVEGTEIRL